MKTWFLVFTAVVAAGLALIFAQQKLAARASEERQAWEAKVHAFITDGGRLSSTQPKPATLVSVERLLTEGRTLIATKPDGCNADKLRDGVAGLEQIRDMLKRIDWKAAGAWERRVSGLAAMVAQAEVKKPQDDHAFADEVLRAAEELKKLIASRPDGADQAVADRAAVKIRQAADRILR